MAETGRILVVDDNRVNRLTLGRSLEQQGHTTSAAEDGYQALEMLRLQPFDLILLDIVMPGLDGFQVLEQIKKDKAFKDIPVIVISALDEIESAVRCIEMGAEDYLPKPFNPVLLRARLGASLEKKKLRDLEQAYLQQEVMLRENERLTALGRLSAGMAHELNNPAAAALRGTEQLKAALHDLQAAQAKLTTLDLTIEQQQILTKLSQQAQERAAVPLKLDPLTSGDEEARLEAALEENGISEGWELAPALVQLGCGSNDLMSLTKHFSAPQLGAVLAWWARAYSVYSILETVNQGVNRVASLVNALKSYTYMDQAPIQTIDIHEGLNTTLTILQSSMAAGMRIEYDYADNLPRIEAYGSELNQVWSHLLRNAVDAVDENGVIIIRTYQRDQWVVVEIEDNGSGIPPAVQPRIFDPFFTTKPPGAGAGLGLNISYNIVVQKHRGQLTFTSEPHKTRFQVKLPTNGRIVQPN